MRSRVRTAIVLLLAAGLVVLFLHNVDLWRVAADILRARPEWLALSLATMFANLAIRSLRWQFLLEPLGPTTFATAFRATAVGFAASSVLPARAGEVIRPYFLARTDRGERMTATGAFATIILERLLDVVTVLVLLASYVFVFGRDLRHVNPLAFTALKWSGGTGAARARRRGADAGRRRRISRSVSRRRDALFRRVRHRGRRRGDRPPPVLDRPGAAARSVLRRAGRDERRRHAADRGARRGTPNG